MIRFSDSFKLCEDWLAVRRNHVTAVLRNPGWRRDLRLEGELEDEKQVQLYLQRRDDLKKPVVWLVLSSVDGKEELVSGAWPIPAAIAPATDDPLEVLRWLADEFGCDIRIGLKTARLFFEETVPPVAGSSGDHQIAFHPEPGDDEVYSQCFLRRRTGGELDVALAFALIRRKLATGLLGTTWS